jgi:hypothetical protein
MQVDDDIEEYVGFEAAAVGSSDLSYALSSLSISSSPFDWSSGGALTPRSARQKASNEASRGLLMLEEGSSPRAWLESAYGPGFDPDKLFTAGEMDQRDAVGRSYHRCARQHLPHRASPSPHAPSAPQGR